MVSINDNLVAEIPVQAGALAEWDSTYRLAFGNELTYDRPWSGEISRASVRVDEVSYDYVGAGYPSRLQIPTRYLFFPNAPLLVPFRELNIVDNVLNVLLFVPLGFILAARKRTSISRWRDLCLIGLFSLTLESVQLAIPTRTFAVEDVGLNVLGGLLGLVVGFRSCEFLTLRETQ